MLSHLLCFIVINLASTLQLKKATDKKTKQFSPFGSEYYFCFVLFVLAQLLCCSFFSGGEAVTNHTNHLFIYFFSTIVFFKPFVKE